MAQTKLKLMNAEVKRMEMLMEGKTSIGMVLSQLKKVLATRDAVEERRDIVLPAQWNAYDIATKELMAAFVELEAAIDYVDTKLKSATQVVNIVDASLKSPSPDDVDVPPELSDAEKESMSKDDIAQRTKEIAEAMMEKKAP